MVSVSEVWSARLMVYDPGCLKVFAMSEDVGVLGAASIVSVMAADSSLLSGSVVV